MTSRTPGKSEKFPSQEALFHSRDLLLALSRAAQSIQRAQTVEEVYRAVGDQIKSLGGEVTLLMVNDDQSLSIAYLSYSPRLISKAEKITGLSLREYRIPFSSTSIYGRAMDGGKTVFVDSTSQAIAEILPQPFHLFIHPLISMFNLRQGVLSPMQVDNDVLGLLKVNGDFLGEDDLPAMDSFAGQIAAGLRNIQLMQKLQNELTARKQVEESLKRSRNLLLALSRAAQAVLSARTADEIYQAVGEQIKCLGHHVVILTASDKNQYLSHTYSTFPQELIETGEKLTGLTLQDYRFHVTPESTYWHALETGIGSFLQQTTESIAEVLPKSMRSMAIILANLLKIEQSVIAPLSVGGKIFGTLTVAGSLITEDDIPAIESFAAQVAISLNNARLSQQAEQELSERKQAETRFKALIENATDGIALMGLDGKTQYVSPSATNMFDDEADNPLEFIHPDDLHIVLNAMNDLIQNPARIQTIEFRYRHRDNFYHWVESTYSNLLAEPSVQAVVINYRDITKRKRVEEALEQRESHYRLLADHMTDTIWLLDMNLKTTYISPSVGKVRGYTLDQLHELPLDQNLTPASLQLAMELLAVELPKILADPNYLPVHTLELEFYNRDGTVYSTESKLSIIRDGDGNPTSILGESRDIAERKRVEEALRASEEKFKSLYQMLRLMTDNLPDLVWAKDMDRRYIFANKAMVDKLLVAQDINEPIGKTDLFFAERQRTSRPNDPDWHTFGEICMDTDMVIHAKKQAERFEEFGNIKGEFLFLDVYKAPFWDEQGEMIGTVGVGRDVTHGKKMEEERGQIQEALAASEAELRALFASMRDTVLVIDRAGVYRSIAQTRPGRLYLSPEAVIGKHLSDIFSEEQTKKFLDLIQQILETQQTLQIEYQIFIDGENPWFESSVSPMGADATLWVARDITERKKIEAELVQSEQAYRTLFENVPIGLYRTTADGQILEANPSLVNMFGYPDRETLLEKNAVELYADSALNSKFKTGILKSGILSAFESEFRRYDQSTFWAEDYVHSICDESGTTLYYEGSLISVTDRKQAEDELRLANTSLESAHQELQQMFANEQILARTDSLTGLYNRRYFFELATREFNSSIRFQYPLTIILFDVDGFKQVNDVLGHAMGDVVLSRVSKITAAQVRDVDVLARYGGDEFIIFLPQTHAQQAFLIAERIRQSVASMEIAADSNLLTVTLSLGVAEIIHASHSYSVESIIRRADKALYMAKQQGRNNTAIFYGN